MNIDNAELPPKDYKEYANTDYWEERLACLYDSIVGIRSVQMMILNGTMITKV